jgi:hypothetical protein
MGSEIVGTTQQCTCRGFWSDWHHEGQIGLISTYHFSKKINQVKTKNIIFSLISLLCIGLMVAASTDYAPTSNSFVFIPTAVTRTITNAGKDTITQANLLSSKWTGSIQAWATTASGTRNVKVYIDETNTRAGGNWITVDSIALTSSVATARKVVETYGLLHRFRLSGTGTQSSSVTVQPVYKKY